MPSVPLSGLPSQSLVPLNRVDQLLRWSGSGGDVQASDWARIDAVARLLHSLPRLVGVDLPDWRFSAVIWPRIEPIILPLAGLTALDVSAGYLRAEQIRTLVRHLQQLRTLRCRPSGDARACLQPLTDLSHLADLGVVALSLSGPPEDFTVIAECRSLRGLSISDQFDGRCSPLLLAPGLRQLRELTLVRLHWHTDWTAVCANLRSLHRLTIDRCGRVGPMLKAVASGGCPQLRSLRIAPDILAHSNSWVAVFRRNPASMALPSIISSLLQRRPEVRIELRVGFGRAGVSASWLLPLRAERDWLRAVPRWSAFELLHPLRHKFRDRPLLFPDSELDCED